MSDRWAIIKAGVVAVGVSALIWIWAEGESLSKRQTDPIELRLPSEPTNDLIVRSDDPKWNGTIRVRLEGTVRGVDKAADLLGKELRLPAALEGMPTTPVRGFPLRLREPISKLPILADYAGMVAEIEPAEISVTVERMVTRQLPVRVELAKPMAVDGDPVATPATVEVRMPESAAEELASGEGGAAVAVIPEADLARARAEGPQTLTIAVRLPVGPAKRVVISPESVSVSLRIKQALDSVKVPTVPVWFSLPPTEDGAKWNIEIVDKFLTDVNVSGSSEDVQRIRSGQLPVKAVVEFTSDELERVAADKSAVAKQAAFAGLPPGVTATVANGTVRVKVSKRLP